MELKSKENLAILIPLYKSEQNLKSLIDRIHEFQQLFPLDIFVKFIVDGRIDDEISLYSELKSNQIRFEYEILILSRNFGVGPALLAGMDNLSEKFIMAMSADLQEPTSLYVEMLKEMQTGDIDLCLGVRNSRKDPFIHKIGANLFWRINRLVLGKEIPSGGFDVFMINQNVKNSMTVFKELNTNFSSQMYWIGFRRKFIYFEREIRLIGKSGWTLRRKVKLFFDSIFSFTEIPILSIIYISLLMMAFSSIFIIINIYFKLFSKVSIPGYYTIASLIVLGNGVTYFFLGIIGGYVYRTFQNSTRRPNYITRNLISRNQVEDINRQ
jgi:glycosyltransferase involved in cell wall biosynthesis